MLISLSHKKNKGNPHKGKKHKGIQNPKRQNSEIVEICQHLQMKMIPARGPQTKDSSISHGARREILKSTGNSITAQVRTPPQLRFV